MAAFAVETDGLHFFWAVQGLTLRPFKLHPPSIYERSPHRASILGRNIRRSASQLGHSSSRCSVESSFCPHSHWSESASFCRYKYFRSRLWSVRSWIIMADSWVDKPLYSLMVCLWGRVPSSFRVKPQLFGFSQNAVSILPGFVFGLLLSGLISVF